jgi:hypothetical protein
MFNFSMKLRIVYKIGTCIHDFGSVLLMMHMLFLGFSLNSYALIVTL